jgi:long-chain fatty acid transport protein
VGNSAASLFAGQPLGSDDGPGFGWRDVTVWKLGVQHQASASLALRGGVSLTNQAVRSGETFFNILAPGVIRKHLTLGATWTQPAGGELSVFYAHGFKERVNGVNSIPPGFPPAGLGGGNANVSMHQNIFGVSYGWKL